MMNIKELNISARAKSCLLSAGYKDIGDLQGIGDEVLLEIKNLNQTCVCEIRNAINSYLGKNKCRDQESITEEINTVIKKQFNCGQIDYVKSNDGVYIKRIDFGCTYNKTKTVVVIPEKMDGEQVIGVLPGAFNSIRKSKYKMILLPSSVKQVGKLGNKLYSDFFEKGVFPKPLIFYSLKEYEKCVSNELFYNALTLISQEDLFGFEISLNDMENTDFICIKKYQDVDDCWKYSSNNMWIQDGELDLYTGDELIVHVEDCKCVSANAFKNLEVEEIIFGPDVRKFSSGMVHDCNSLKKIIFESAERCWIGEGSIYNCSSLSYVKWPVTFDFEKISIFNRCPLLGSMIVYNRLLTCQENDEFVIVDNQLTHINNRAFMSCENMKIIYIPENIEVIENDAFDETTVDIVIISGKYTKWKANTKKAKHMYIYCIEGSNVMNSVSPFEPHYYVHIKNIKRIANYLEPMNKDKIIEICYSNMNEKSDEEMIIKPYGWRKEIYQKV